MFRVRRAINSVRPATLPLVVIVGNARYILRGGNGVGNGRRASGGYVEKAALHRMNELRRQRACNSVVRGLLALSQKLPAVR